MLFSSVVWLLSLNALNPLSLRLFLVSTIKDGMFQINDSVDLEVDHIPFPCYRSSIFMSSVCSVVAIGAVLAVLHLHKNKFAQVYQLALTLVLNYTILRKQQQKKNKRKQKKKDAEK